MSNTRGGSRKNLQKKHLNARYSCAQVNDTHKCIHSLQIAWVYNQGFFQYVYDAINILCVISGRSDIGSSFQHHILMVKSTKLFSYDKYNSLLQADKRIPQS